MQEKRIFQLISNELSKAGLSHHPFLYVIEGKGKRGYGATNLHIHGIIQTDDPSVATAFKLETRKNRLISGDAGDVEAAGRTKGIVRADFHDARRSFRRFAWFAGGISPCTPGVRGRSTC